MTTFDLLILILYITFMVYVVYRARETVIEGKKKEAAKKLEGKFVVEADSAYIKQELDRHLIPLEIEGAIKLELGRSFMTDLDSLTQLPLTLDNLTTTYAVYVDWKDSALTTLGRNSARPIACIGANRTLTQTPSLVPPQDRLIEFFTLQQDEITPVVDPGVVAILLKLGKDKGKEKGKDKGKDDSKGGKELGGEMSYEFWLRLAIRLRGVNTNSLNHFIALTCPYRIRPATSQDMNQKIIDFKKLNALSLK
jgi:hypothetical protein